VNALIALPLEATKPMRVAFIIVFLRRSELLPIPQPPVRIDEMTNVGYLLPPLSQMPSGMATFAQVAPVAGEGPFSMYTAQAFGTLPLLCLNFVFRVAIPWHNGSTGPRGRPVHTKVE
jgi:hypothetical protein